MQNFIVLDYSECHTSDNPRKLHTIQQFDLDGKTVILLTYHLPFPSFSRTSTIAIHLLEVSLQVAHHGTPNKTLSLRLTFGQPRQCHPYSNDSEHVKAW